MESDSGILQWIEPPWGRKQRRETIHSILFNMQVLRIFFSFVVVGIIFTIILYCMGEIARNLIGIVWWTLAGVSLWVFVSAILQICIYRLVPAYKILIHRGQISFSNHLIGSMKEGDVATIESDEEGHRWLVVRRRCGLSRVGIPDEIEMADIEEHLKAV